MWAVTGPDQHNFLINPHKSSCRWMSHYHISVACLLAFHLSEWKEVINKAAIIRSTPSCLLQFHLLSSSSKNTLIQYIEKRQWALPQVLQKNSNSTFSKSYKTSVRVLGKMNHYYISAALNMNYTHHASVADNWTSLALGCPTLCHFIVTTCSYTSLL